MGAPSVRLIPTYSEKKSKAIRLRKLGRSYREIAQAFQVSKATAYAWTRKVKLSISAHNRIQRKKEESLKKGLIAYNKTHNKARSQKAARVREKHKNKALKEIRKLSLRDLKLIGIALYWAEGNKKNRNTFSFSNSDPSMIKVVMRFLREVVKIPDERVTAKMHLYPQIKPQKALSYWSRVTNLPKTRFAKPFFQISKASKRKRNYATLPYGTLHLQVYSTEVIWRVRGWIEGVIKKLMRVSYNGHYATLPRLRRGFDSLHPLR